VGLVACRGGGGGKKISYRVHVRNGKEKDSLEALSLDGKNAYSSKETG